MAVPLAALPIVLWRPPATTETHALGWLLITIAIYGFPLVLTVPVFMFARLHSRLRPDELRGHPLARKVRLFVRVLWAIWAALILAGLLLLLA